MAREQSVGDRSGKDPPPTPKKYAYMLYMLKRLFCSIYIYIYMYICMYIYIYAHMHMYVYACSCANLLYVYLDIDVGAYEQRHLFTETKSRLQGTVFWVRRSFSLANEIGTEHRARSIHMMYHTSFLSNLG